MGIIRKQGIINTLYFYIGVLLGYLNLAVLMTSLLTTEQYGLRNVIFQLGSFYSAVTLLGSPNIMNRFFPFFKDKEKGHNGILGFILSYSIFGGILIGIITILAKPLVIHYYSENASLLVDYYYTIIPFGLSLGLYEALSSYCRVLFKTTTPTIIKEFAVRVVNTALLIMLKYEVIDFDLFFKAYLGMYFIALLALIVSIVNWGEFHLRGNWWFWKFEKAKEMIVFGLFTLFNASMSMVVKTADLMMLTVYFDLRATGVYGFGTLVGNVINMPSVGLKQIAAPMIAEAFKQNDLKAIESVYRKTALTQLISGLFFFGVIVLNLDSVLGMMKEDYLASKYVVYYIGIARLVEMASGINNRILMDSPYYIYSFLFNLVLVIMVIISNLIFIPVYGLNGAAFASALSILIITILKISFVHHKYKFNPYDWGMLKAVAVVLFAGLACWWIPSIGKWYFDIAVKTTLFSIIFIPITIFWKISEDINLLVRQSAEKFLGIKLNI